MRDRAQVYTLEAFVAALLVLASLVVALQITAVTPLSASTANEHVENQQGRLAAGLLDTGAVNGTLKPTLLYWNDTNGMAHGVQNGSVAPAVGPPTAFGRLLDRTLSAERYAYNLKVSYLTTSGNHREEFLVRMGTPSETVASVSRTVTLYDDDRLYDASGDPTGPTLANATAFYAPDAAPQGPMYNVVRMEVVLWRL